MLASLCVAILRTPRGPSARYIVTPVSDGRLDGPDVVYLATRESRQYRRAASRVGRRLPAYATALGKALLAERFGADRDDHIPADLVPLTPRTVTDRAELEEALETARVRGYAPTTRRTPPVCGASPSRCATAPRPGCDQCLHPDHPADARARARGRRGTAHRGDKVSRVLRPVANGDKWFAQ
jgi:hypothetical protein